jgi:hypothetical protein
LTGCPSTIRAGFVASVWKYETGMPEELLAMMTSGPTASEISEKLELEI